MTTWRGPWDGAWDGRWEGEAGTGGGPTYGDMAAVLPGGGGLQATLKASAALGMAAGGVGSLTGTLAGGAVVAPPQWGGGARWTGPYFAPEWPPEYRNIAAVMAGRGRLIARPVAAQAIEAAAVLAGGGKLTGELTGTVDERRLDDDLLMLWAA